MDRRADPSRDGARTSHRGAARAGRRGGRALIRPEDPVAIAGSESGAIAVLDRGGARLWLDGPVDLDPPARALAFAAERVVLLVGHEVKRPGDDTAVPVPPGACCIAFTMGGGLLVGTMEALFRFGDHPLEQALPEGFGLRALCVDPSGYWLGGASRVIGYRPTPDGLEVRREFEVASPVRALAYGPDGALYTLLESHALLRDGEHRADCEAIGLARSGHRLLALQERSVEDVTRFVDPPPEKGPDIVLPRCDS